MDHQKTGQEKQLNLFRERITAARRHSGHFQKDLAASLGLDTGTLSRKLHDSAQMHLTPSEVKQIIKTLAMWEAITTQDETCELLTFMGLNRESFSSEEWQTDPLRHLVVSTVPQLYVPALQLSEIAATPMLIPEPLTSFIGREEEIQHICHLLRSSDVRLLTLLGTAGVGKTRLSIAVAHQLAKDFPDGIYFISLATIQDALLVPLKIAETLQLNGPIHHEKAHASSLLHLLITSLQKKRMLLILDNLEHLLSAAAFIGDLLTATTTVTLLITSRAPLHLYGEHEWVVPSFTVPNREELNTHDQQIYALNPAIRLFIARASAVKRNVHLTEKNSRTIIDICRALDGIPLAIELAAARCKFLSPQMILSQLVADTEEHWQQGRRSSRSAAFSWQQEASNIPQRQRTLVQTLDWSFNLLDEHTQYVFLQLGVFLGGWTLSALKTIYYHKDKPDTPNDLLQYLEQLVNHSLVIQESSDEETTSRFTLLEIVREYAMMHLENHEVYNKLHVRHSLYYLELAEQLEPDLSSPQRWQAIHTLIKEEGNLRAALHWSLEQKHDEFLYRLCGALSLFWEARSQFAEAHEWLDKALAITAHVSARQRAKVLLASARLAQWEGNWEQARAYAEQALSIYESDDDKVGKGHAIFQIGDAWHMQGAYAKAIPYFEQSLAIRQETQDWRNYAFNLSRLGAINLLNGAFVTAQSRLVKSVELFRLYGDPWGLSIILTSLAILYLIQENIPLVLDNLYEALSYGYTTENSFNIAIILTGFGCAFGRIGYIMQAAQICSAAETFFTSLGTTLPTAYQPLYNQYLHKAKEQADKPSWDMWWEQGKVFTQKESVTLAFQCYEHRRFSLSSPGRSELY